tara:strand:- start:397 stop:1206 length:810 start_codon:yes stop_codon:yes gene_type:complete
MFGYNVLGFGGGGAADVPEGQQAYTSAGSYTWTAPDGVNSVCVVCIGAGGRTSSKGLGGGGLGYINDYSVTPGNSYTVVVGAAGTSGAGGDSYFVNTSTVNGEGGAATGGSYTGDGGGDGGDDGQNPGGGAGGYSGNGGDAASNYGNGSDGSGGGAGGGGQGIGYDAVQGAPGGGTGILGEGTSGEGGSGGTGGAPVGGEGGSGGGDGVWNDSGTSSATGGNYGGGGGIFNAFLGGAFYQFPIQAAGGAVRIIWGTGRAFPSTNTADVE